MNRKRLSDSVAEFYNSDKPSKRFVAIYNGKKIYFGQPNAFTYLDGASDKARDNYRARHLANKTEKQRIENLIPSAALFSYYLIWGEHRTIEENIKDLSKRFETGRTSLVGSAYAKSLIKR
jgi:hypothetical protein